MTDEKIDEPVKQVEGTGASTPFLAAQILSEREHDSEIRECANDDCDRQYDLARQDYFGPLCPTCTAEENGS